MPNGVGVSDGFTDGLTVSIGAWFPDGNATGVTASALVQIHPTLNPVVANAAITNTNAPTNRALVPGSIGGFPPPPRTAQSPHTASRCPYASCPC